MNDKTLARLRRARKARVRMRTAGDVRLTVNRTTRHIYAVSYTHLTLPTSVLV